MRAQSLLFAAAIAVPSIAAAQTVPTRTLTKADAEWSEPFSSVNGIRELKNGRVIVSDNRDRVVQMIDFTGTATKIGREGSGPGEFGLPMALYAAPGDTTWLWDVLNSRFLVIDPTGKPVSTFSTADAGPGAPAGPITLAPGRGNDRGAGQPVSRGAFGLGVAQGIDAMGRLYFRAPTVRFSGDGPSVGDSTPIIRWDRKTKQTDTVGVLVNPPSPPVSAPVSSSGGDGRVTVRIGGSTPLGSADALAVTSQGNVAIVRAKDYHVDWIINGKSVSGAPIKYDRVKVTDEDKRVWAESRKNATATMVVNGKVQNMPMSSLDGAAAPEFPEFKGPFRTAIAAPNQQIWVERYMPAGTPTTYDVIDGTGKVVSRVVLPKRTRLIGFGNGTAYLVRMDEDDLQYLQRYRL